MDFVLSITVPPTPLCEINPGIAILFADFRGLFDIFASFSEFLDLFGPVRTCSDLLGCIWVHSDASGCILRRLEHFGNFQKNWSEKLVFCDFLEVLWAHFEF